MEFINKFLLLIITEILFLAFSAALIWLLISRRQLRRLKAQLADRDNAISTMRQRLELTHESLRNLQQKQAYSVQLLNNYRKRIVNLEKFKALYFELNDHIVQNTSDGQEISNANEINRYKERIRELEDTEAQLLRELADLTQHDQSPESNSSSTLSYGSVKLREPEELKTRLKARENEIRQLRQECETIGSQYEELAAKSLALASERDDLTNEQKSYLAELKQKLTDNKVALARKQAECEMLEESYLELEKTLELPATDMHLQQAYSDCNSLREDRDQLHNQLENNCADETTSELLTLRQQLAEKEAMLDEVRREYKEIKEQFIEVAQEENRLRLNHDALQIECEKLRSELHDIKDAHGKVADQQHKLEKLRDEYSKMETRYIALMEESKK